MKKIMIIGHVDHGRTCLQSAIDSVAKKEIGITIIAAEEASDKIDNDYFKHEAFKLKCFKEQKEVHKQVFDKPKSKFHK